MMDTLDCGCTSRTLPYCQELQRKRKSCIVKTLLNYIDKCNFAKYLKIELHHKIKRHSEISCTARQDS